MTGSALNHHPSFRVLIVEDDPQISELIALTLRDPAFALTTAETGAAALEALSRETPDLVVLDILIPDPDGWKVYEHIRGDPALSRTSVIILTALQVRPEVLAGKRLRAQDRFMKKPFDLDDLRSIVKALLAVAPFSGA
ncbi:MAG TPA: response regulator [Chitinivibrionales bacterium]|nr:response regulator [Chitinivibrionales bacterium]